MKEFIGEHYHYSNKPVFKALWDNYNDCQFVEDEGDIIFYKNARGFAAAKPVFADNTASDSGIEIVDKDA